MATWRGLWVSTFLTGSLFFSAAKAQALEQIGDECHAYLDGDNDLAREEDKVDCLYRQKIYEIEREAASVQFTYKSGYQFSHPFALWHMKPELEYAQLVAMSVRLMLPECDVNSRNLETCDFPQWFQSRLQEDRAGTTKSLRTAAKDLVAMQIEPSSQGRYEEVLMKTVLNESFHHAALRAPAK